MTAESDELNPVGSLVVIVISRVVVFCFGVLMATFGGFLSLMWWNNGGWGILFIGLLLNGFSFWLIWLAIRGNPLRVFEMFCDIVVGAIFS